MGSSSPQDGSGTGPSVLKLGALLALIGALGTVPAGFWRATTLRTELAASGSSLRQTVAEDLARMVLEQTEAARAGLRACAGPIAEDASARTARLLVCIDAQRAFDQVVVYDSRGEHRAVVRSAGAAEITVEPELVSELRDGAIDAEGAFVGDVTFTPEPRLWLYLRVRPTDGDPGGFLAAPTPLTSVGQRLTLIHRDLLREPAARLYVADRRQTIVASNDPSVMGQSRLGDPLFRQMDAALVQGVATTADYPRDDGDWVGTVVPLPSLNWAVAIEVPHAAAYAPARSARNAVWAAGLFLIGLAGLALVLRARLLRPK